MFVHVRPARAIAVLAMCGVALSVGAVRPELAVAGAVAAPENESVHQISHEYLLDDTGNTSGAFGRPEGFAAGSTSRTLRSDRNAPDHPAQGQSATDQPSSDSTAHDSAATTLTGPSISVPLPADSLPMLPEGFVLPGHVPPSHVPPTEREDELLIPEIAENYSITDPESQWVMVNKQFPIDPIDFEPENMRVPTMAVMTENNYLLDEAATALEALDAAVKEQTGHSLVMLSAFRSHDYQENLYSRFARQYGETYADQISARTGHSEHQTGWAVDVGQVGNNCITQICFGDTAAGIWVAENAWEYGFIIRYPQEGTEITGFSYEPWHLRYVGKELAEYMHQEEIATLEEALRVGPAPDYEPADTTN